MENKEKGVVAVLVIGLLLILQIVISVPVTSYFYKGVGYEFNAKVEQCESALENYNDKETDFINYERTNTDNMALDNEFELRRCRKIINNPKHYVKGEYLGFLAGAIYSNFLVLVFIVLLGALAWCLCPESKAQRKEKEYWDNYSWY